MSKQAVVHSSRLRYNLELPPCSHRQHEPRSSCIHTTGCPHLPWHCQPHLVEARYGGYPNCLSRSSRTRLARFRFPSTSPLQHSRYWSFRRLGRVCRPPLSPVRYRKKEPSHPWCWQDSVGRYGLPCWWYQCSIRRYLHSNSNCQRQGIARLFPGLAFPWKHLPYRFHLRMLALLQRYSHSQFLGGLAWYRW